MTTLSLTADCAQGLSDVAWLLTGASPPRIAERLLLGFAGSLPFDRHWRKADSQQRL